MMDKKYLTFTDRKPLLESVMPILEIKKSKSGILIGNGRQCGNNQLKFTRLLIWLGIDPEVTNE